MNTLAKYKNILNTAGEAIAALNRIRIYQKPRANSVIAIRGFRSNKVHILRPPLAEDFCTRVERVCKCVLSYFADKKTSAAPAALPRRTQYISPLIYAGLPYKPYNVLGEPVPAAKKPGPLTSS